MSEGLMLAMLIALALTVLALKMRSLPIMFISSLGWLVAALQVFQQTEEMLPMALMLMLALGQFFLINSDTQRS